MSLSSNSSGGAGLLVALREGPASNRSAGSSWGQSGLGPRASPDGPTRGAWSLRSMAAAEALGADPEGSGFHSSSSLAGVVSSAARLSRSAINKNYLLWGGSHNYVSGNTIGLYDI